MSDKKFFSQGNASFEKGDFSRAISFYSSAIDLNPKNMNYYRSRCISFIKNKDFNQAISDASMIASRNPEKDCGFLLLGVSCLASNQLEKAKDYFVSALQRNPENPITKSFLDKISKNRQTASVPLQVFDENFQDMISQFQGNPTIVNDFAGNLLILNALNNYLDAFDRPTNVRYAINKSDDFEFQNKELLDEAKSNFKDNQFEKAIELCHKGIMNCNGNTESETVTSLFQIITSSYMKTGEIDKADKYLQEFKEFAQKNDIEINNSILKNCEYIQIAYQNYNEARQKNCAISHYEQSKRSDEMPVFFKNEISSSVKDHKIELASQISNEAVAVFPNDPTLRYKRAKVNFMIEQYDDAIADCLKAVEIKPDFAKAHFLIAKCYMKKNKPRKARFFVRRTLFYDKENTEAAEMIDRIKDMIHMQKEEKMKQQMQQQEKIIIATGDNNENVADGEIIGEIKTENQKESDASLDGQIPQQNVPSNFQEIQEGVNQDEQNNQNSEQQNFNQDEQNNQNFEQQSFNQDEQNNQNSEQQNFNQDEQNNQNFEQQNFNQDEQNNQNSEQQNFNQDEQNNYQNDNIQYPHSQPPIRRSPFSNVKFQISNPPPSNHKNVKKFSLIQPQNH